jgi:multiple sugar transport system substrate-binding protein
LAGGLKPDVVSTHVLRTAFFVRSDALVELSEMLDYEAAIQGVRPDYIDTYTQIFQGKLYTAPFWTQPTAPVYNKTMVADAGLDPEQPPDDWETLLLWLETLGETHEYPVHLQDTNKWAPIGFQIEPVIGMLINETKFPLYQEGRTNLDEEVGVAAFELFKHFYDQDWVLPSTEYEEPFHRGEVPILWAGNVAAAVNRAEQIGDRFEWGHFHGIPMPPGAKVSRPYAQDHGGYVNVIPSVSEHQPEAWEFVKFVMSKDGQEVQVATGYPTVRTDVDLSQMLEEHPFLQIPLEEWFAYTIFDTPYNYNELEDLIFKAYQQITLQDAPIQATLTETADKIEELWAEGLEA